MVNVSASNSDGEGSIPHTGENFFIIKEKKMKEIHGLSQSLNNNYHATTDTTLIIKSERKSKKKMAEENLFFLLFTIYMHFKHMSKNAVLKSGQYFS